MESNLSFNYLCAHEEHHPAEKKNLPFSGDGDWSYDSWCKTCSLESNAWTIDLWCSDNGWCSITLRQGDGLWLVCQWRQWPWWQSQWWVCVWAQTQRWEWQHTSAGTACQSQHDYNCCELQLKMKMVLVFVFYFLKWKCALFDPILSPSYWIWVF